MLTIKKIKKFCFNALELLIETSKDSIKISKAGKTYKVTVRKAAGVSNQFITEIWARRTAGTEFEQIHFECL